MEHTSIATTAGGYFLFPGEESFLTFLIMMMSMTICAERQRGRRAGEARRATSGRRFEGPGECGGGGEHSRSSRRQR